MSVAGHKRTVPIGIERPFDSFDFLGAAWVIKPGPGFAQAPAEPDQ